MSQPEKRPRRNFILPDGRCKTIDVGASVSETIDIIRQKKWDLAIPETPSGVRLYFGDKPLEPASEMPHGDVFTFFYIEIDGQKSDALGFRCSLKPDYIFARAFPRGTTIAQIKQAILRKRQLPKSKGEKTFVIKNGSEMLRDDMTIEELISDRCPGNIITAGYANIGHARSPVRAYQSRQARQLPKDDKNGRKSNLPVYRPHKSPRRVSEPNPVPPPAVPLPDQQPLDDMPIIPKMIEEPQPVKKRKRNDTQPSRESFNQCQVIRISANAPLHKRSEFMPCHATRMKTEEEDENEEESGPVRSSMPDIKIPVKFMIQGNKKKVNLPVNASVGDVKKSLAPDIPPSREFTLTYRGKVLNDDNQRLSSLDNFVNSGPIDVIVQEEDEANDGPLEYKFSVGRDSEPLVFRFKTTDTVEIAKKKVARANGVTKEDVEIMFAGKKLNDRLVLSRLRIPDDAIIPVYVKRDREVMLRTPKALVTPWKTFNVKFVLPKKEAIALKIAAEMTIGNVKELLSEKMHIDSELIDLIFAGKLLEDNTLVGDVGVTGGSEVLVYIMEPDVASLRRSLSSGVFNTDERTESSLVEFEEKILKVVTVEELEKLRKLVPVDRNILDAELVVTYLRYHKNMDLVKEHFDRAVDDDGNDF